MPAMQASCRRKVEKSSWRQSLALARRIINPMLGSRSFHPLPNCLPGRPQAKLASFSHCPRPLPDAPSREGTMRRHKGNMLGWTGRIRVSPRKHSACQRGAPRGCGVEPQPGGPGAGSRSPDRCPHFLCGFGWGAAESGSTPRGRAASTEGRMARGGFSQAA